MRFPARGLLCILALIFLGSRAYATSVCAAGQTVQGVDVSNFDGTVNWNQVAASGRVFAYARVNDGGFIDPQFAINYPGIKAAGMLRGAYQFFEPAQDPTVQANTLLTRIGTLGPGDLPPMLDVEITGGQSAATIAARIQTWINAVQSATGRTPVIFTSAGFWNGSVMSTNFSSIPLWVANFGVTCPTLPTGWQNWILWFYSASGSVPGITPAADLDEFNGSLGDLQVLAAEVGLDASPNPAIFRQNATFTATVSLSGAPTGTVTFMDGARVMKSVPVSSRTAILRTNQFSPGRHSITAVYSGDSNFPPNTSSVLSFYRSPKPH